MAFTAETELDMKRLDLAEHIVRCVDTVTLMSPAEVEETYRKALFGEYDEMLDWRSPHLRP